MRVPETPSRASPHSHTLLLDVLNDAARMSEADAVAHFFNREMKNCAENKHAWFSLGLNSDADLYSGCRDCMGVVDGALNPESPYFVSEEAQQAESKEQTFHNLVGYCKEMLKLSCCQVDHDLLNAIGVKPGDTPPALVELGDDDDDDDDTEDEVDKEIKKKTGKNDITLEDILKHEVEEIPEKKKMTKWQKFGYGFKKFFTGKDPEGENELKRNKLADAKALHSMIKFARNHADDKSPISKTFPYHGHAKCDIVKNEPVDGVAEIHLHMFSHLAFGGMAIHGAATGDAAEALKPCDGKWNHGVAVGAEYPHDLRRGGYPDFNGWPRWDGLSHQQSHESWLKEAVNRPGKDRLALIHMTPVHNSFLCGLGRLLGKVDKKFLEGWIADGYSKDEFCENMPNMDRQLKGAIKFAEKNDWFVISKDPETCRKAINEKKLCVVLNGGESGNPCAPTESAAECVDRVYALGGRSFQILHLRDNRFAGSGFHTTLVDKAHKVLQKFKHELKRKHHNVLGYLLNIPRALGSSISKAFEKYPFIAEDSFINPSTKIVTEFNPVGLSKEGHELVEKLISKGMMIDIAHTSRQTQQDVFAISKKHNYYPMFRSHDTFTWSTQHKENKHNEYQGTPEQMWYILKTGGIVGLRTEPIPFRTYLKSRAPNVCAGSSLSNSQMYEFMVRELGIPVAMAGDLNGAARNFRPRFWEKEHDPTGMFKWDACGGEATTCYRPDGPSYFDQILNTHYFTNKKQKKLAKAKKCPRVLQRATLMQNMQHSDSLLKVKTGKRYDGRGMATIDDEISYIVELRNQGVEVDCPVCMTRSAENFIRTWERTLNKDRKELFPAFDFKNEEILKLTGATLEDPFVENSALLKRTFGSDEWLAKHADTKTCDGDTSSDSNSDKSESDKDSDDEETKKTETEEEAPSGLVVNDKSKIQQRRQQRSTK